LDISFSSVVDITPRDWQAMGLNPARC